jgi:hypothetical protein
VTQIATSAQGQLVLVGAQNGVALIPSSTPLTRLNYFDGKFLRAEDLTTEQSYLRSLVRLSNQAGGAGIVHGFTTTRAGDVLEVTAGLAIDPAGHVLFLPNSTSISILELIEKSREGTSGSNGGSGTVGESVFAPCETAAVQPPSVTTTFPTDLYLIAIAHAEALCGEEDVYGKLCEDACITSTDRPFRTEGVVIRALPLTLCPPTCDAPWLTATHRRSQVASAYFATERALNGKNISGTRLMLDLWCNGSEAAAGSVVPLALISMNGDTVEFLDAWTARRERIENPPRRYWAWQLMMRPWNVYLAQILQFQCHLHWALSGSDDVPGGGDPCAPQSDAVRQAIALLEEMETFAANATNTGSDNDIFRPEFLTRIGDLKARWSGTLAAADGPAGTRILITEGIVELPPAGYLPVVPGGLDVNTQVRRLLGEGVDLRFCSVRPDYVAHALEEAQHMERICLLRGIEDPEALEEVDILVPDGLVTEAPAPQGSYFETTFSVSTPTLQVERPTDGATNLPGGAPGAAAAASRQGPQFRGAGRAERLGTGGGAFHFAGALVQTAEQAVRNLDTIDIGFGTRPGASTADPATTATAADAAADSNTAKVDEAVLGGIRAIIDRMTAGFTTRRTTSERAFTANRINRNNVAFASATAERESAARANLSRLEVTAASRVSTAAPALWTTMRCEKDPFALAVGESSPLRLEAALGASLRGTVLGARLVVQGDLFCDQKGTSASAQRIRGRAWGWLWTNYRLAAGDQVTTSELQPRFIPVDVEVELTPSTSGGGRLVIAVSTQDEIAFTATTEWNGSPTLAGLSVVVDVIALLTALLLRDEDDPEREEQIRAALARLEEQRPELREFEFARARLRENADVRNESNAHHAAAALALRMIERALDEDGFRAAAEQLLFPPALPATTEPRVLASRDWVLFHRRRTNSCDCCRSEGPVAAPPRRFQVYEITAPEPVTPEQLREFFASGEGSIERFAEIVGVVEFTGDTASLSGNSSTDQIRNAWRLANPAASIIYGALAAEGAAVNDPEPLGQQRVARVSDIVRSITPVHATAEIDVLPLVPEGLSAQGVNGVIFLVTIPQVAATQCHRVVSFRDQGMMSFALERIGRGELAAVIAENFGLGEVGFQSGTNTVADNSLEPVRTAWSQRWPQSNVARALLILPSQGAIPQSTAESQAQVLTDSLSGQLTEPTARSNESVFGDCDGVILLEPTQRIPQ